MVTSSEGLSPPVVSITVSDVTLIPVYACMHACMEGNVWYWLRGMIGWTECHKR
jgi:hypothetical protein